MGEIKGEIYGERERESLGDIRGIPDFFVFKSGKKMNQS